MRLNFIIIMGLIVIGCAVAKIQIVPVDWIMFDHPDEDRIEPRFKNQSGKTLCLSNSDWPTKGGKLDQMQDFVYLLVAGKKFPIAPYEEYCPTGCITRVLPGEEIVASIPYGEFKLPESLRYEPKKLEFPTDAYVCR